MASPANNVFLRLHKWAWRQDENFLTESLAVVLEHLLVLAPAVGVRLVARLTGGFIDLPPKKLAQSNSSLKWSRARDGQIWKFAALTNWFG